MITTINRIAIITTINRIAIITTIDRGTASRLSNAPKGNGIGATGS